LLLKLDGRFHCRTEGCILLAIHQPLLVLLLLLLLLVVVLLLVVEVKPGPPEASVAAKNASFFEFPLSCPKPVLAK